MGIRVNPLTVMITTASEKLESPFRDTLKSYKKILRGEMENDSVFAHIFEPDVDDEEDNPETWKKVQPHLGITVQDDYYELEYKKAQQSADGFEIRGPVPDAQCSDRKSTTGRELRGFYISACIRKS